jgi:uncharacterized protein
MRPQTRNDLAAVRRLLAERLQGMPVRLWLFGSQARGTARPGSDIDVALALTTGVPWPVGFLAELRAELEESSIVARVDLVDLAEATPEMRRQVEMEGIEWIGPP